ncbi:alpha/beta-hydrolase, partial [Linderina pennispora]
LSAKLNPSYGYVAHKPDTKEIIASWRGSTVFMDFVKDLTFVPVSWPAGIPGSKVHLGFLQAYQAAAQSIEVEISKLVAKFPDYSIVITGHSLGSAQATLATVDLALRHPEWVGKMKLFTYGEPRVGNPVFAAWLSQQALPIYRVVYGGDMAPRLPFRFMGFEHHSQEVWYDKSGALRFQGSNGESPYGQNSLTVLQWDATVHYKYPGL